MTKPRVGFCWWCGAKLRGRHHATISTPDGDKVVHKACEDEARAYLGQVKTNG